MNRLKNLRKSSIILFVLMIVILWVIFCFSSENSEESGDTGISVARIISEFIFFDYENFSESEQNFLVDALNPFVRKLAHFCIYMTLGMTVYAFYLTINLSELSEKIKIKKSLLTLLTVFVFASFDEIHQYFVPGRSARFTDVLIDSSGATLGIIIIFVIVRAFKKKDSP